MSDVPSAHPPAAASPLIAACGVVMEFPGVRALDRVGFEVAAGEIHALLGENGAGKSTLVRILAGLQRPTEGTLRLGGRDFRPSSTLDAEALGVSTVFQEIDLIPTLSVADNLCLGREPTRWGLVHRRRLRARAATALRRLHVDVDLDRTLGDLPTAMQQLVAICRAVDGAVEGAARVLLLDEPTSSLDASETETLFAALRRLRERGLGIVFVTHFIDQVYALCDRITVLRNGVRVGCWASDALPRPALVEAMTGRRLEMVRRAAAPGAQAAPAPTGNTPAPALAARSLGRRRSMAPVSLSVDRGEALGLAGLLGSGRTELARLLFGADAPDSGAVEVSGTPLPLGSVRAAIAAGMAMIPEDRKSEGLLLEFSVRENILLALQSRRGPLRPLPRKEQERIASHYIEALSIQAPDQETPVGRLSGGNQQKVLLARWLAVQPHVLILDEPTRGIDVGARAEIDRLLLDLRAQGMAIVLISAELEEVVRLCDRALVLRDRAAAGELAGARLNEAEMLATIAGQAT